MSKLRFATEPPSLEETSVPTAGMIAETEARLEHCRQARDLLAGVLGDMQACNPSQGIGAHVLRRWQEELETVQALLQQAMLFGEIH